MHSAAQTETDLFRRARIKLTAWYVIALAAVLRRSGFPLYSRRPRADPVRYRQRDTHDRRAGIRQYHLRGTVRTGQWTTSTTTVYFVKHAYAEDVRTMPRAD